jgi:predicted O-methyltransferase YrrM
MYALAENMKHLLENILQSVQGDTEGSREVERMQRHIVGQCEEHQHLKDQIEAVSTGAVLLVTTRTDRWFSDQAEGFVPWSCLFGRRVSPRRLLWVAAGVQQHEKLYCKAYMVSISNADVELFLNLQHLLPSRPNVFTIGNGFGYSLAVLATIFHSGHIDTLTLGGLPCEDAGIHWARRFLYNASVNGDVYEGRSPGRTPEVAEGRTYDLAFIDGDHGYRSVLADFEGIQPFLANTSIIVFHDGSLSGVRNAIDDILSGSDAFADISDCIYYGSYFRNIKRTRILYRGFGNVSSESFCPNRKRMEC